MYQIKKTTISSGFPLKRKNFYLRISTFIFSFRHNVESDGEMVRQEHRPCVLYG